MLPGQGASSLLRLKGNSKDLVCTKKEGTYAGLGQVFASILHALDFLFEIHLY